MGKLESGTGDTLALVNTGVNVSRVYPMSLTWSWTEDLADSLASDKKFGDN
jgi:hypothetical protein